MNTNKPDTEQRRFKRLPFDAKAELLCAGSHWHSNIIDLSLHGALIERPGTWEGKPGDQYLLEIALGDGEIKIKMQTSVIHIEAHHIGLNCIDIDIDSVTHLRRFVELNLGDQELLDRELSALSTQPYAKTHK